MLKNLLDKFRQNKVPANLVSEVMFASGRLPVSFIGGQGCALSDIDGNEYLDAFAADGVTLLGHSHPAINEAISLQAAKLLHAGNRFYCKEQAELAALICDLGELEQIAFSQTLAEANLAALELAYAWASGKNIKSPIVLSTSAQLLKPSALTKCADGLAKRSSAEYLSKTALEIIALNDIDQIGKFSSNESVAAVFVHTVSTDGQFSRADADYLVAVRDLCDEHDWLMILDESRSSFGRMGDWFYYQHCLVTPDVVVAADSLANGLPLGFCATHKQLNAKLALEEYASTFGGNQLASRTSITLIEELRQSELVSTANETGEYLKRQLQHRIGTMNRVKHICGKGLFITIELDQSYADLATQFLLHGLVIGVNQTGNLIYLVPALNLGQDQALLIARKICSVLETL